MKANVFGMHAKFWTNMIWAILIFVFVGYLMLDASIKSSLKSSIESIAQFFTQAMSEANSNNYLKLNQIERRLDEIFEILGGEQKEEENKQKQAQELRIKFEEALKKMPDILRELNPQQTQVEIDNTVQEHVRAAEIDDLKKGDFGSRQQMVIDWFERQEKRLNLRKKYVTFLESARNFVKTKNELESQKELESYLNVDSLTTSWLIEELEIEGVLKPIRGYKENYHGDEELVTLKWEVVS